MVNLHEQNARVIDAAADRLFRFGWFRLGEPCQSPYAECAIIAIGVAALAHGASASPLVAVRDFLGREVSAWNDEQPDADTVIAKLRECADAERAKAWSLVPA